MIWALYVLGGNAWSAGAIAIATLVSWWYFSDYFMAPILMSWWQPWMDLLAYIFVSIFLSIAFARGVRRHIIGKGFRPDEGIFVTAALPADVWADMLSEETASAKQRGAWLMDDFLRWRARLLCALPKHELLRPAELQSVKTKGLRSIFLTWGRAAWLPLFVGGLLYVPLCTGLMEFIAARKSSYRNMIFALGIRSVTAGDRGVPLTVEEDLSRGAGCYIRKKTVRLDGEVLARATDFPRTYRQVEANCPGKIPGCQWPNVPEQHAQGIRLRGGAAKFAYLQTPGSLELGMTVVLKTRQGQRLDYVCIQ